jgi:hypothetical protein
MLVELNVSQCTFRKLDRKVTSKATSEFHAQHDAGRFNKATIAKEHIKDIEKVVTQARTYHYANTLPWADNGPRILPSANYFDYTAKMREFKAQFEAAVQSFLQMYPQLVIDQQARLGDMYDANDYPAPALLQDKYRFVTGFLPMPEAGDFRVDISQMEVDKIRSEIEDRNNTLLENSMKDLWQRLYENVERMAERLGADRVDPKSGKIKAKIFRDSLVDNLIDLCSLLPKLNLTHDPKLEEMRQMVEGKLCGAGADELRDNDSLRRETAASADEILKQMASYCGVK